MTAKTWPSSIMSADFLEVDNSYPATYLLPAATHNAFRFVFC